MLQKKNADFLVPRKSASLGREEFSLQIGGINRAFFQRDGARRAKSGAERQKGNPERTLLALAEARLGTGLLELLQATMSHYAKTPLMKPVLDEFETCFDQKKGKTKEQVRLLITVFGDERVSKQLLELCRKKETAPLAKETVERAATAAITQGVPAALKIIQGSVAKPEEKAVQMQPKKEKTSPGSSTSDRFEIKENGIIILY